MDSDFYSAFAGLTVVITLIAIAVYVGLIIAVFMIAGATRRTARATEHLAREVSEIKARLASTN